MAVSLGMRISGLLVVGAVAVAVAATAGDGPDRHGRGHGGPFVTDGPSASAPPAPTGPSPAEPSASARPEPDGNAAGPGLPAPSGPEPPGARRPTSAAPPDGSATGTAPEVPRWLPPGPDAPDTDGRPDPASVYDRLRSPGACRSALGLLPGGRLDDEWRLLRALATACLAVQGQGGSWETAARDFSALGGHAGTCKGRAAYAVLSGLLDFHRRHPSTTVRLRAPAGGPAACTPRIVSVDAGPDGVAGPGERIGVELTGVWFEHGELARGGRVSIGGRPASAPRTPRPLEDPPGSGGSGATGEPGASGAPGTLSGPGGSGSPGGGPASGGHGAAGGGVRAGGPGSAGGLGGAGNPGGSASSGTGGPTAAGPGGPGSGAAGGPGGGPGGAGGGPGGAGAPGGGQGAAGGPAGDGDRVRVDVVVPELDRLPRDVEVAVELGDVRLRAPGALTVVPPAPQSTGPGVTGGVTARGTGGSGVTGGGVGVTASAVSGPGVTVRGSRGTGDGAVGAAGGSVSPQGMPALGPLTAHRTGARDPAGLGAGQGLADVPGEQHADRRREPVAHERRAAAPARRDQAGEPRHRDGARHHEPGARGPGRVRLPVGVALPGRA